MDPARRKLNLQGLLRYAVEQTNGEEATVHEVDPERAEFLQNALKSMTIDVIQEFEKAVAVLENQSSTKSERLDSLNVIRSYIDDLDLANNFVKFGGTTTILRYTKDSEKDLQALSNDIIAEMSQNNPYCQNHFLNENIIPQLLIKLNDPDEELSRSSIYAISSLIRNFEPGLKEFLRVDGIQVLVSCLRSPITKVYIKSAFLISSLASQNESIKEDLIKNNAVEVLLENINYIDGFDSKLETTLSALLSLSSNSNWAITKEKQMEVTTVLKQIISKNKELDNCEDTVKYAENILEYLNGQKA
ncbi:hsp70 nucleotide exchange factor FES1 [Scaptodrosophila lebanonensis]|uniref:Hsp70 nucleotide exchange factor FES1 n=1 Tax=Drosophila lebanonensis TaxID=7225 RepID=A0A6J2THB3_DROLE|nr:hsp70 nucleotide exchange factor FES1 [Scaptodrosophila lebanonensis]